MMPRLIHPLLLLLMLSPLRGQESADSLMLKGNNALSSGLYEVAALHFNALLANPKLDAEIKSLAGTRLAETWIRDGKPADALRILDDPTTARNPDAPFWKAQALAGLRKFQEAIDALAPLTQNPKAPNHNEAVLTTANLELAIGKPESALTTLTILTENPDTTLAAKARLHQVEILLELGRTREARETLPAVPSLNPKERPYATLLEAHLLLAEGRPADAASNFQTLVDQPQGQSLRLYHEAVLGLADSLRANQTPDIATDFLLNFIQTHPDSPKLGAMFKRLQDSFASTPTPNDPILERLAQWITPAEVPATGPVAATDCRAVSAWPTATQSSELLAYSLFTRAIGLHRIGTPEANAEARILLTRLRLENPDHPLNQNALFLTAKWNLEHGNTDRAFVILDTLRETSDSPAIKGEAAFLQAKTANKKNDKATAIRLFEEAARSLSGKEAELSRLNAAIIRLTDSTIGNTQVIQSDIPEDRQLTADLDLERALVIADPRAKRNAIEEFLKRHPDHPRMPEARLAAAEAALTGEATDLTFARTQFDLIAATPNSQSAVDPARLALAKLRADDVSQNPAATITAARAFLEAYPDKPSAAEASLVLGRNLFKSRNYNDARLVLEKLAATDTDPARAQAAWLLAARSAALVPTSQSQQEALILFDKAIDGSGPLAPLAHLEKARLMIDMNRLIEAAAFLRKWFDGLKESDPLHLPAGLLLGEAIYAQGSINPNSLAEALQVYDKLLPHARETPAMFDRLQYLRGRTLEQLPDEKNPALKQENKAFIAYYSVLETTTPPAEWQYFELCGFRALALLEKAKRWPAAIACAKKIASFNGPRAEEAASRARQLQLNHFVWED